MILDISAETGEVVLSDFTISPQTKVDELPSYFTRGLNTKVYVERKQVECIFSVAEFKEAELNVKLELRFESGVLVSIFISLSIPDVTYENLESFYLGALERESLHLRWLQKHLGNSQEKYTSYSWGKAGVSQNRSGEVSIFLHNLNNKWAN